jgi:putative heme-binding domain-containing protein
MFPSRALLTCLALASPLFAAADAPYGLDRRPPLTTSHISGSPEPPAPYRTVRAYPNLKFKDLLDVEFAPGLDRVFVLEQGGKLYSFPMADEQVAKADVVLDIQKVQSLKQVPDCTGTHDSYSVAFHPQFAKNHYVYLCYTLSFKKPSRNHDNGSRISRFTMSTTDPPTIDPASEQVMLTWMEGGHNGCTIKFGPTDGYLYISTGDAGDPDPPDPYFSGQDVGTFLSKVLRIDVDHPGEGGKPYAIPPSNPFIHTPGARPEVYVYGLRNPWRMAFDRQTGFLWIGDVGWELWESVCCATKGGENFGWSILEGPNPVHPDGKRGPTPLTPPAIALNHSEAASLTGGIVYHGKKLQGLQNYYVFGDWQTQRLWVAKCNGDRLEPHREIALTDQRIVSFGEQPDGELLIADHQGGGLWRIVPNEVPAQSQPFPRKLSETGLFTSTKDQSPQSGVIPFSVNASQWVDGATAQRWVAVPGNGSVIWGKGVWGDDKPAWPRDSALVRTLSLDLQGGRAPVETQVLHFDGRQWQGYSYAWNEQHTDADLVGSHGDDKLLAVADNSAPGGVRKQIWRFPSRAQCMTCHNSWSDYTLAFNDAQLDRTHNFGSTSDNEVRTFRHIGLLLAPKSDKQNGSGPSAEAKSALTDPYDAAADVTERARSYLHVNCSHCHRFGGGGSALFDVRKELPLDKANLVNAKPNLGGFNLDDPRIICAGSPARSVLIYRMSKLGRGRMPHIGSDRVDERGVALMRQWAIALASTVGPPADSTATADHAAELRALNDPTKASTAADKLLSSTSGALALLAKLDEGKLPAENATLITQKGIASQQDQIRDLFRRFDPTEQQTNRLGPNIDPARLLALQGDAERGRQIFYELAGTGLCARCHITNGKGTDFGPDLSHIASRYSRAEILDNILNPSKTIAQGYTTYNLQTKAGDLYSGFLITKTDQEVVIKDATLKVTHVPTSDVQKLSAQVISAMPEGLLSDLEAQQAADLLEFVSSLK